MSTAAENRICTESLESTSTKDDGGRLHGPGQSCFIRVGSRDRPEWYQGKMLLHWTQIWIQNSKGIKGIIPGPDIISMLEERYIGSVYRVPGITKFQDAACKVVSTWRALVFLRSRIGQIDIFSPGVQGMDGWIRNWLWPSKRSHRPEAQTICPKECHDVLNASCIIWSWRNHSEWSP